MFPALYPGDMSPAVYPEYTCPGVKDPAFCAYREANPISDKTAWQTLVC